jgi:hypothetical protein
MPNDETVCPGIVRHQRRAALRSDAAVGRQGAFLWMMRPDAFVDDDFFSMP